MYFHTPIRAFAAHTVLRVRVQIGHPVSRALLPKIIADPHPVSCLQPPKSITNIIRRFFCLYHDLLDDVIRICLNIPSTPAKNACLIITSLKVARAATEIFCTKSSGIRG